MVRLRSFFRVNGEVPPLETLLKFRDFCRDVQHTIIKVRLKYGFCLS